MSLRWRKNNDLICGAKSKKEKDDCYIDDRLHYKLSEISRVIIADVNHESNGLWHWVHGKRLRAIKE